MLELLICLLGECTLGCSVAAFIVTPNPVEVGVCGDWYSNDTCCDLNLE